MFRLVLLSAVFTVLLSGCVKRSTYNKTGKPVVQNSFNKVEAAKTRIALGLQYLKVGEMSSAKYNLEKAIVFAPTLPSAHSAFAHYYQKVGENELAEKAYQKALSFDQEDPDTLNNYGAFLCRVKRYKAAESAFLQAIAVPSYLQVAQSYENAGLCAMENKKYDKAKVFFTQSLDHSALRANTLVNVASLSYAMGEYRDAQKYTQRLNNIGVISPRVLLLRSLTELKLGNITQSKKHGTMLVSMYVKSREAMLYLSRSFENSEFEQLRRLYLKDQYDEFKLQQKENRLNIASSTKIKKKLKPQNHTATAINKTQTAKPQKEFEVQVPSLMVSVLKPRQPEPEVQQQVIVVKPAAVKVQDVIGTNSRTPAPETDIGTPFHVVKSGQFLYDISIKYNIKMRRLSQWNRLTDESRLRVGRKIYLNDPNVYHIIDKGDTLFGISSKYNIIMVKLLKWNDLTVNTRLVPGQRILIVDPEHYFL
jgi:type IV pilus assembly protein PilF